MKKLLKKVFCNHKMEYLFSTRQYGFGEEVYICKKCNQYFINNRHQNVWKLKISQEWFKRLDSQTKYNREGI